MSATRSRIARCSRATASNQLGFSLEARAVLGRFSCSCEPIRTFPAKLRAHHGPCAQQMFVRGLRRKPARRRLLLARPVNVVVGAICLDSTRLEIAFLGMQRAEAAHVEGPQIHAGSPWRIQFAMAWPAPPEAAMPAVKPQARKQLSSSGAKPMMGSPSAETGMGPLMMV